MPALPSVNWDDAVRAFGKSGWQHDRTRGSHYIMTRPARPGLPSVPMHKPIRRATLRKLIREADLTVQEFVDLLYFKGALNSVRFYDGQADRISGIPPRVAAGTSARGARPPLGGVPRARRLEPSPQTSAPVH